MGFEGSGDQDDFPAHRIGRHAPLDRFFDVGKDGVNPLPNMAQDRLSERSGLGDICVDAGVAAHRKPPPSISLTMPTMITNRLRLRPLLLADTAPMPAPTTARGMISQ